MSGQLDLGFAGLTLNERQQRFVSEVGQFSDSIAPGYLERARTTDFFWDVYREAAELGYLGITTPERWGGMGESAFTAGLLMEEIGRADFNVALSIFSAICNTGILSHATPAVRDEWIPRIVNGEVLLSFALTEPGAGSDARAITTRAKKVDGGWRLTGNKTSSGLAAIATTAIVFARTGDGPSDISVFFVELSSEGVSQGRIEAMGAKPFGRGTIDFENVFIPEENLVGEVGTGFGVIAKTFDFTRSLLALLGVGFAKTAIGIAKDYVSEREAFGRKLSSFQGVTFPIAEHLTKLEAARWLSYRTLALRDAGLPHTMEAAMVKWYGPEVAVDAIHDSMILLGHRGYADAMPLQQMYIDASGLQIGDGTPQIQKLIISREVFGSGR